MSDVKPAKRWAFVDETFRDASPATSGRGYYQLAAALLEDDDVDAVRKRLATDFGQNGPFKASNLGQNTTGLEIVGDMLDAIVDVGCFSLVVVRHDHQIGQEIARQDCVKQLLRECESQSIRNVVLDSREAVIGPDPEVRNKKDLRTRTELARNGLVHRSMRVTHLHDDQEPLLWIPDAVGWAHRRHLLLGDSAMWDRVESMVRVIDLQR